MSATVKPELDVHGIHAWTTKLAEFRASKARAQKVMDHLTQMGGSQTLISMTWCGVAFPLTVYDHSYYTQRIAASTRVIYDEIVRLQKLEVERWDGPIEGAEFKLREAVKALVRA